MNFPGILSQIQNYFKDYLRRTGGVGAYTTFSIDLSVAHDNEEYTFTGDQIIIVKSDSTAYIRLNDRRNENINTTAIGGIETPFTGFFITNEANTGALEILVGTEGIFSGIKSRISAIITDINDAFGHIHQVGNAELAVRLGAISTVDRRGNVYWTDSFEDAPIKWIIDKTGTGSAVAFDTNYAKNGKQSLKMTTGNAIGDLANITHLFPKPVDTRLGFEISFTANNDIDMFLFGIDVFDGATRYISRVRYHPDTKILEIMVQGGGYETIATDLELRVSNYMFHTLKFVIDYSTKKYVRCVLDGIEYSISQHEIYHGDDVTKISFTQIFQIMTAADSNESVYVDAAVVTLNEP